MPWWTGHQNRGLPTPISRAAPRRLCTMTTEQPQHRACMSRPHLVARPAAEEPAAAAAWSAQGRLAPAAPTHPPCPPGAARASGKPPRGPTAHCCSRCSRRPPRTPEAFAARCPLANFQRVSGICVWRPEASRKRGGLLCPAPGGRDVRAN